MARVISDIKLKGKLGSLSFYSRHDIEGQFVRTPGGVNKKTIATSPSFALTRSLNAEFGGCSKMGKAIRQSLFGLKHMADHNISATLNALMKYLQVCDIVGTLGKRSLLLSQNRHLLLGFSFNKKNRLESIVNPPFQVEINRQESAVTIIIPSLLPRLHLQNQEAHTHFQWTVCMGIVSDMHYSEQDKTYLPESDRHQQSTVIKHSAWFSVAEAVEQLRLELKINPDNPLMDCETLVAGLGFEWGNQLSDVIINPVKHGGAARIVAVG